MSMTEATLKNYLKSLKYGGSTVDNTMSEIVDAAAEAGFGNVWGAHFWKVARAQADNLTTTAGQAYTNLPNDFDGIRTLVLIDGTRSRKINIVGEDNFESDYPNPSTWSTQMPLQAKLAYSGAQKKWRIYWQRVPDAAYTMRLVYRRVAELAFLPNCPGYMDKPVMLASATLILPPGPTQNNQMAAAEAALKRAIESDNEFVGAPEMIGTEAGFNDCFDTPRRHVADLDNPFSW